MKKATFFMLLLLTFSGVALQAQEHQLTFPFVPKSWDEGMPMGNGMLGALLWQKGDLIRMSLDRADLWDERPMKGLHRPEFSYSWVHQQVLKGNYKPVQEYFDAPYDREPAPTKIPGAALEWKGMDPAQATSTRLDLQQATCTIVWENGNQMETFVSAVGGYGMFRIRSKNVTTPALVPPNYVGKVNTTGDVVGGDDLTRLGYPMGRLMESPNGIRYEQNGWNGFAYRVSVRWKRVSDEITEGIWTIRSSNDSATFKENDSTFLDKALALGFQNQLNRHVTWWKGFWNASSIRIPDQQLQFQYEMEMYKFGSATRPDAPPISLQAVWTADNGRIPPWKGDYHHDLNTQLSYWPAYASNHLDASMGYVNHLQQNKETYKRYTAKYFGVGGMNVPGVTTLKGTEMGGWIQYSLSPTVGAWLAHHFRMQWKYSMDRTFLAKTAYPWVKEVANYLLQITVIDSNGFRKLPLSSSPEIHNNDIKAWFQTNTNYDLALMKSCFENAREMAEALGLKAEAQLWGKTRLQFEPPILSNRDELMFAKGHPYDQSHRHFSHLMAIHPLGEIRWEDGSKSQHIINQSLHLLDSIGPSQWVGYSYAWEGNLKARARDGEGAAKALKIFSEAFCLPNSFHVNGDQSGKGYANARYRPFTLEGNFAFASGILEMLIQSHAGHIEIMPAVPETWKDISFEKLRAEGAFLVSATRKNGKIGQIRIFSEKGGMLKLKFPLAKFGYTRQGETGTPVLRNGMLMAAMKPGSSLDITLHHDF